MTYDEYNEMRTTLDLTDYAVSQLTGVSKATLSQWKNGKLKPSKRLVNKLEFFFENYDPKKPWDFYITMPNKARTTTEYSRPEIIKETFWVESFGVKVNNGVAVELTERQYDELKKNTEIFADTWLKANKIIN